MIKWLRARCPVCNWPKSKCWCPKVIPGNCPKCGREQPCFC